MPDDARVELARRIFLICNPPDTPQELFDDGGAADRALYFRLADLTLAVAHRAVQDYRAHQETLEAALGDDQTDGLSFPLAEEAPVLVEAWTLVSGEQLTTVVVPSLTGREAVTVRNGALRPR